MPGYDYSKLLGRLREKRLSQKKLAEIIGIAESSMNLKLNNKAYFRQDEITRISKELEIPLDEYGEFFFCEK